MASKPSVFAELIGIILSTYFGGRTDVKIRRSIRRVLLTDFLSLYSTIGAICGMWRFIVGNGFTLVDATNELTQLLDHITLDDLQEPDSWKKFNVLVQIEAHNDVLPVRAMYSPGSIMRTIGVNELEEGRLWYVAADIVGSTLRTGRRPKILKALRCVPGAIQEGLRPVHLAGSEVLFNPYKDDFFKFIIERRIAVKAKADEALRQGDTTYSMRLYAEFRRLSALVRSFDDAQMHLKVVANACYGFFIEMNANKSPKPVECDVYSYRGKESRSIWLSNVEEPGPYFHPLVGTMITAGARLMLMLCELLAEREGIDWMLCDTDSMLYAKPDEISDADFIDRVERIQQWFRPLNPYANADDILKFEGVNYRPGTTDFEPLYGLAIAPKSYVTFNLTEGEPIIREGKQFLLENYVTPYTRSETEERECRKTTKLRCWQRDVWLCVIRAFLAGRPDAVDLSTLPNFNLPAARRLSVSTTEVEKHLAAYNQGKPYRERIRPGGFLLSFTPKSEADREYLGYENSIDRASESDLSPVGRRIDCTSVLGSNKRPTGNRCAKSGVKSCPT